MATTIGRGLAMRVRTLKPTNSFADYPKKAGIQDIEETGFSAAVSDWRGFRAVISTKKP